jgi:hypothetical protein
MSIDCCLACYLKFSSKSQTKDPFTIKIVKGFEPSAPGFEDRSSAHCATGTRVSTNLTAISFQLSQL